jgi:cytidylate kinase
MKGRIRSIEQIIEEHVHRWEFSRHREVAKQTKPPVVTLSREPGSGGRIVAEGLAEKYGLSIFHQEVIHDMAQSAKVSKRLLETLDEKGISMVEDWISAAIRERHLWPDEYLQHLMKVIGTIGSHGAAVIIGRGANFILPPEGRFRVRVIAPLKVRVERVARDFDVTPDEAKKRIIRTESNRRAFIRKYFNADIADPNNYDVVMNTGTLSVQQAVGAIGGLLSLE